MVALRHVRPHAAARRHPNAGRRKQARAGTHWLPLTLPRSDKRGPRSLGGLFLSRALRRVALPLCYRSLALGQAEPVPRVVAEDGLDAVRTIRGLLQELHALFAEFLIGPPAVVGFEHARTERAARDERTDGLRGFVVVHRRARLREDELEIGLLLRPDREPPKAIHRLIAADFAAELLRVKGLCGVLVEYPHGTERVPRDHFASASRSLGLDDTKRSLRGLLRDCELGSVCIRMGSVD